MTNDLIEEQTAQKEQEEEKYIEKRELNDQVISPLATLEEVKIDNAEQQYIEKRELNFKTQSPVSTSENKNETNSSDSQNNNNNNSYGNSNFRKGGRFNGRNRNDEFEEKVISMKRINKTTKGGRRMRFSALAIVGDKKGRVGFGKGKSVEAPEAIKKAIQNAKKNLIRVQINKKGSIFHEIICNSGATKVLLKPAPIGTGIIAGGAIRTVIELAGFKDICSKKIGASSTINMVRATLKCLTNQRSPQRIAFLRDKGVNEL